MPSTKIDPGRITVTVRLYSILRHRKGQVVDRLSLELPAGSRLQELIAELQIDPNLEVVFTEQICSRIILSGNTSLKTSWV